MLSHGPIEHAGAVTVSIGAVQRLFAVNVDTRESMLAALDRTALLNGINLPVRVIEGGKSDDLQIAKTGSADIAPTLLCFVIALLLLEMWLAMRFGAARGSVAPPAMRNAGVR